ncbi:MAG: PD-(D/E)XK nuclease family protein [Campylobacterales bacterium]|nr:PD-(D/E)XK nuclease family protein [Campylobacterales bacterium]
MDTDWLELQKVLISIQGKIETIESIQKLKGETFNIFSVLQMERLEVQTHSAFIFELLSQNGTHSQGTRYLELFVFNVLNLEGFDFTNVKVKREDPTDDGRRIDFTIENDNIFIAIEMKIDAADQPKQLIDYEQHAKNKGKDTRLYYLTLDGREASDDSTQDNERQLKAVYEKISFSSHILDWIELSIEKSAALPIIRETLVQYANLIRKITGHTSKEITMEVVKIINNPQIAKAATQMSENIGYAWAHREAKFWSMLHEKLEHITDTNGWELFFDEDLLDISNIEELAKKINSLRSSKNARITGAILNRKGVQIDIYQWNSTGLRYYLSNNVNIDEIAKVIDTKSKDKDNRYGDSKIKVKFYGKNVESPTYELFDDELLEKLVSEVADEIESHLAKINKILEQ